MHTCNTRQFWVHKQNKDLDGQCILVKKEENKGVIRERAAKEVGQEGGAELFENHYVFSVNLTQAAADKFLLTRLESIPSNKEL